MIQKLMIFFFIKILTEIRSVLNNDDDDDDDDDKNNIFIEQYSQTDVWFTIIKTITILYNTKSKIRVTIL